MIMTQPTKTRACLLTSTVIPAFMSMTLSCNASAFEYGNRILLAQQQEPAEKSDRPERKRPEGAPGTSAPPGAGRPSQAPPQGTPKEGAAPPQTPAPPERRELPKGPA